MPPIPEDVRRFREAYRASWIGPGYSGWGHFAFTSLACLGTIALAASQVRDAAWHQWLAVPLTFLFANGVEYAGHRGPMHHPVRGLRLVFERHTLQHHHFYTHEAMAAESPRDFKMTLFPPVLLLFFLGAIAGPIGAALFLLVSDNAGWLFVATAMGYFLLYEWLHFAYHQPPDSRAGRIGLVRVLRRHHTAHHQPAKMGRFNFNITFPIFDALVGTIAPAPDGSPSGPGSAIEEGVSRP